MIKCNDTLAETHCKADLNTPMVVVDPVWHGYSFRTLGWVLASIFAGIATMLSLYLIWRHATHYSRPYEQRHIIRILFMVPIYSIISVLSYLYYWHAVYFKVIRDCYEAFAIASFFFLLCHYIAPDLHAQKDYFRKLRPKHWPWPARWFKICCGPRLLKTPESGLTWFNIIWFGVFQYCFVRVTMTIFAVVTQSFGMYCEASLKPIFAHIWIMAVEAICVIIAMYCLIAFYITLRDDIAPHKPFFKLLSIKLVIFLCFWQAIAVSVLTSTSILKTSNTVSYGDLKVGLPTLLICVEMSVFAVMHLFAYPWKVYRIAENHTAGSEPESVFEDWKARYQGGVFGVRTLMDAFNPWDLVKAFGRGVRWIFIGRRSRHEDSATVDSHDIKPIRNDTGHYGGGPEPCQGSFGSGGSGKNGKPGRYSEPDDEREELLTYAQSNPTLANNPDGAFKSLDTQTNPSPQC
ncbi:organic solute transporter Ostalpha-domain-containing protein [Halenospora varia]|nr:organic solute transporter Ostalpha-domain-containing protein [Halenospora varia]